MPSFTDHCAECRERLGEDFAEVHQWLDALFAERGPRHRRVRHHLAGVEEVRRQWGDKAAEAALLHVVADLRQEGWRAGRDRVPRDEADYVRMGLF